MKFRGTPLSDGETGTKMLYDGPLAPRYIGRVRLMDQTPSSSFARSRTPMAEFNIAPPSTGNAEPSAKKDQTGENFPVASRLLPKRLRPHVMAFYRFVRLGDDIADDPDLEPELKLSHLDALERALIKGEAHSAYLQPALDLFTSLKLTGLPDTHARQVLQAFRRDAKNTPCRTWSDLML